MNTEISPQLVELEIEDAMTSMVTMLSNLTIGLTDADGELIRYSIGGNANVQYLSEQFALRDYCWCDFGDNWSDEPADPATSIHATADGHCPPNFEHYATGVSLRWYKHLGRGIRWQKLPATRDDVIQILLDCLKPLVAGTPSRPRSSETRRKPS